MLALLKKILKAVLAAALLALLAFLLWAAALQFALPRSLLAGESLVKTDTGWVQGWRLPGRTVFLGIPYAQAPVGDLRFTAPQAVSAWAGTRLALLPKPMCAQPAVPALRLPQSTAEDCLGLNIFKPINTTGKPLPVMVWIHGGGFVIGSANFTLASDLAMRGQVMVVAMNYRLGSLGFLAHPALATENAQAVGNYGLLDQQLAINWVKRNAAALGGDANNITLFGQSAGGSSVCAQLLSPAMAGQFQAAIVQSGVCDQQLMQSLPAALELGQRLAQQLGCDEGGDEGGDVAVARSGTAMAQTPQSQAQVLACLRAQPVEKLLSLLGRVGATSEVPLRPVYDTPLMPQAPDAAFAAGQFNHMPVLVGSTRDEGSMLLALEINQSNQRLAEPLSPAALQAKLAAAPYAQAAQGYFGAAALPALQAQYPAADYGGKSSAAVSAMLTDAFFACGAERLRRSLSARGLPVYAYEFAEAPAGGLIKDDISGVEQGAYHGAEFASLFYYPFFGLSPAQQQLAGDMQDYWSSFARTHRPVAQRSGAAVWPAYSPESAAVLSLQASGSQPSLDFAQRHHCAFWNQATAPQLRVQY